MDILTSLARPPQKLPVASTVAVPAIVEADPPRFALGKVRPEKVAAATTMLTSALDGWKAQSPAFGDLASRMGSVAAIGTSGFALYHAIEAGDGRKAVLTSLTTGANLLDAGVKFGAISPHPDVTTVLALVKFGGALLSLVIPDRPAATA